jgi:hypothetical protein
MNTGQRAAVAGVLVLAGSVAPLSITAGAAAADGSGGGRYETSEGWPAADRGDPPRAPGVLQGFDVGTSRARLEARIAELRARIAAAIDQWDLQRMQVLQIELATLVRRMEGKSPLPVTPLRLTLIRI